MINTTNRRPRYDPKPGDDPNLKRCPRCETFKPLSAFGKKYVAAYCGPCRMVLKYSHAPSTTIAERFWAKVDKRGPDECWNWTGVKSSDGYGALYVGGKVFQEQAHRVSLRLHGIEPPQGGKQHKAPVCDHTCRNRACVNPAHLRIVTQRVNTTENSESPHGKNARKTVCKHGHPFDGWMKPKHSGPTRVCLTCRPALRKAVERFESVTTEHGTALFPK